MFLQVVHYTLRTDDSDDLFVEAQHGYVAKTEDGHDAEGRGGGIRFAQVNRVGGHHFPHRPILI